MQNKENRVGMAIALKIAGKHPSKKEMIKIAKDGLYTSVQVVRGNNDDSKFEPESEFGWYQYIEMCFTSKVSSSSVVLSCLPWKEVVSAIRSHGFVLSPVVWVDEPEIEILM